MGKLRDYRDFAARAAEALNCAAELPEIAAAIGNLKEKAERYDLLTERLRVDVIAVLAALPTDLDLQDLRAGLEAKNSPVSLKISRIRAVLSDLARTVEGID